MIASLKLLGKLKKYSLPELILVKQQFENSNFTTKDNLDLKADIVLSEINSEILSKQLDLIKEVN